MSSQTDQHQHWVATRMLTVTTLIIWAFFSFVVHWFGHALNSEAFPGSYFMAGMGSQLSFAILIFWFSSRQDKLDEEFGLEEAGKE